MVLSYPCKTGAVGCRIGLNEADWSQVWGDYPDRDGGIALLRHAVDVGITFVDTADVYGPHSNEILIHDALHPYPDGLVIATKGGFFRGGYDYSTLEAVGNRNYLRQSAQMSARRLGVEQIDLYYLHSGRATDVPFEDQVATLAELREQGLIANIGLSNVTTDQFHAAQAIVRIAAVTAHYNPAVRIGAELLDAAEKTGAVFSPWHPVTVTETGDPHVTEILEPIARQHEADHPADRPGLAAAPLAGQPAHPRNDKSLPPDGQPGRRDDPPDARRDTGHHGPRPGELNSLIRPAAGPGHHRSRHERPQQNVRSVADRTSRSPAKLPLRLGGSASVLHDLLRHSACCLVDEPEARPRTGPVWAIRWRSRSVAGRRACRSSTTAARSYIMPDPTRYMRVRSTQITRICDLNVRRGRARWFGVGDPQSDGFTGQSSRADAGVADHDQRACG